MHARQILIIFSIACTFVTSDLTAATSDGFSEVEHFPLSKGSYRLAGECTKLTFLEMDITAECLNYVGILAANPDRPEFLFPRKDSGAWIFKTSSSAHVSDGGVATYKVESVTDITAKRISRYNGECVLTPSGAMQGIHCTLWNDQARQTVVREAVFSANGSWLFEK
jgi:hypothetical protein